MSLIVAEYLQRASEIKKHSALDSDEYLDLLAIESKIDELSNIGALSDMEQQILQNVMIGVQIHYSAAIDYPEYFFWKGCDKVAEALGGYFTTEGFIEYMVDKYKLDVVQQARLKKLCNKTILKLVKRGK